MVVLSSPSGAGKTTVATELVKKEPNLIRSISWTTRPRRRGETQGRAYIFVSRDRFKELRSRRGFLEWARVYRNFYGTPRAWVEKRLRRGKDVLFVIDVQGARHVRRRCPDSVLIFLKPPGWKTLRERLARRGTESPEALSLRLRAARKEMAEAGFYDYRVVNDRVTHAVARIRGILRRERARRRGKGPESALGGPPRRKPSRDEKVSLKRPLGYNPQPPGKKRLPGKPSRPRRMS